MAHYFPPEIFQEILLRLPAKSICCFRSVCKSWCFLISSKAFIASHLNQNLNRDINTHLFLTIFPDTHYKNYFLFHPYNVIGTKDSNSLCVSPLLNTMFPNPRIVGICHGLICFISDYHVTDPDIVLWNPSIRKSVTLPKPGIKVSLPSNVDTGFGADTVNNDYKVVRIVYGDEISHQVEIFSLRTGEWRRIKDDNLDCCLTTSNRIQPWLNDRIHWIGCRPPLSMVMSFCMHDEVFRGFLLPDALACYLSFELTVSVSRGCLAVILYEPYKSCWLSLWAMKEYGVPESWSLMFTLKDTDLISSFVASRFTKSDNILVQRCANKWGKYDPESNQIMYFDFSGLGHFILADKYEESLVLLNHEGVNY